MSKITVAAFYQFTPVAVPIEVKSALDSSLAAIDLKGTVLVAPEGINGTIAGPQGAIEKAIEVLRAVPGCEGLDYKQSFCDENPFYRLKVRIKKEIVSMGAPEANPNEQVGDYVEPEDWNTLIQSDDVVVIDTRNDYEVSIGSFEGAINPETKSFREFPDWFRKFKEDNPDKKIAMFCTGGIRCEKATSLVKHEGVADVYHLKGGILKYLERISEDQSLWNGECFVFDNRVSVKHGLAQGQYDMCHACRRPVSIDDKQSPQFMQGISCSYCYDETNASQRERFAERQKQIGLAKKRGEPHIGATFSRHRKTKEPDW